MVSFLSEQMIYTLQYMATPDEATHGDRQYMISKKDFIVGGRILGKSRKRRLKLLHKYGLVSQKETVNHLIYSVTAKGKGIIDSLKITGPIN